MDIDLKFKPKRSRIYTKKWVLSEEFEILDYFKKVTLNQLEIEKPSARIFYEKMMKDLKWRNVSVSQLKNKVRHLKNTYIRATEWRNHTERDVNIASVRDHILSICPHWDILDEIFGTTTDNTAPPYVYVSCDDDHDDVDAELPIEEIVQPFKKFKKSSLPNTIRKFRSSSCSSSTLSEAPVIQKNENETNLKKEEIKLSREKFEFEKEFRKKEIELEYKKIESQEKIRILELEKEERIEKLKLEYDFKLQIEYANRIKTRK